MAFAYVRTTLELRDIERADLEIQFGEHEKVYRLHGGSLKSLLEQVDRFPSPGKAIDALHAAADDWSAS